MCTYTAHINLFYASHHLFRLSLTPHSRYSSWLQTPISTSIRVKPEIILLTRN